MFSPPLNNVVVQVTQKYTRNMSNLLKIAAIQQATTIEPADYVSIVGTVVALPMEISKKREYEGFTTRDIRVGMLQYSAVQLFMSLLNLNRMPNQSLKTHFGGIIKSILTAI